MAATPPYDLPEQPGLGLEKSPFVVSLSQLDGRLQATSQPSQVLPEVEALLDRAVAEDSMDAADRRYFLDTKLVSFVGTALEHEPSSREERRALISFLERVLVAVVDLMPQTIPGTWETLGRIFLPDPSFNPLLRRGKHREVTEDMYRQLLEPSAAGNAHGNGNGVAAVPDSKRRSSGSLRRRKERSGERRSTGSRRSSKSTDSSTAAGSKNDVQGSGGNNQNNNGHKGELEAIAYAKFKPRDSKVSYWFPYLINYFGARRGFDAVIERLSFPDGESALTPEQVHMLLEPLHCVRAYLTTRALEQYVPALMKAVTTNLILLPEALRTSNDREAIEGVVTMLTDLMREIYNERETNEVIEQFVLRWALKNLRCAKASRRLAGSDLIKEAINRALLKQEASSKVFGSTNKDTKAVFVTVPFMVKWLHSNDVIDCMLKPHVAQHVLGASTEILTFLAQFGDVTKYLPMLWEALTPSANAAVLHVVHRTLSSLVPLLNADQIAWLQDAVLKVPLITVDYRMLGLAQDLTLAAARVTSSGKAKKGDTTALSLMWNILMSQDLAVSTSVRKSAYLSLGDTLNMPEMAAQRMEWMERCLAQVAKHESTLSALEVLHMLISEYPEKARWPKDSQSSVIEALQKHKRNPLLPTLFQDLDWLVETAWKRIEETLPEELQPHGSGKAREKDSAICGVLIDNLDSLLPHLQQRLLFLESIFAASSLGLSVKYVDQIWSSLIAKAFCPSLRTETMNWLRRLAIGSDDGPTTMDDDVVRHLLTNLLAAGTTRLGWINETGYAVFRRLFIYLNEKKRRLDFDAPATSHRRGTSGTAGLEGIGAPPATPPPTTPVVYGPQPAPRTETTVGNITTYGPPPPPPPPTPPRFALPVYKQYRALSLDLIGGDALWRIAFHVPKESVFKLAMRLLVSLHVKPGSGSKLTLRTLRSAFVSRCMTEVRNALEATAQAADKARVKSQDSRTTVGSITSGSRTKQPAAQHRVSMRALQLLHEFINAVEVGSGRSAGTVSDPSRHARHGSASLGTPVQLQVAAMDGIPFTVTAYTHESLGSLRKTISERMDYPGKKLRIVCAGKELTNDAKTVGEYKLVDLAAVMVAKRPMEDGELRPSEIKRKEEIAAAQAKKRRGSSGSPDRRLDPAAGGESGKKRRSRSRSAESGVRDGHPTSLLAQDDAFHTIMRLLEVGEAEVRARAWGLLNLLPTNPKVLAALTGVSSKTDWNKLLAPKLTYQLLYSLDVVETLRQPPTGIVDEAWTRRFIDAGGLRHMFQLFMRETTNLAPEPASVETLAVLSHVLLRFALDTSVSGTVGLGGSEEAPAGAAAFASVPMDAPLNHVSYSNACVTAEFVKLLGRDTSAFAARLLDVVATVVTRSFYKLLLEPPKAGRENTPTARGLELVKSACEFVLHLVRKTPALFDTAWRPRLTRWLAITLLINPVPKLRKALAASVFSLWLDTKSYPDAKAGLAIRKALYTALAELMPSLGGVDNPFPDWETVPQFQPSEGFGDTCESYFRLLHSMLADATVNAGTLPDLDVPALLRELTIAVREHPVIENEVSVNRMEEDLILTGLFALLHTLLLHAPKHRKIVGVSDGGGFGLINELFSHVLFPLPERGKRGLQTTPKAKVEVSRSTALDLLILLSTDCRECHREILGLVRKQLASVDPPHDWKYSVKKQQRSPHGYVGLRNQGATCYMNSLLQQFFMIPQFRRGLMAADDKSERLQESMLWQTQMLFSFLQESQRMYYDDVDHFSKTYTGPDGQPINVRIQQDANEFFNLYFDRLETKLKGLPQEKLMDNIFGGKISDQMICSGEAGPHTRARDQTFYTLSVDVKGLGNIEEGLRQYVQGEEIDGVLCEPCNQKVRTTKRATLKELPNTLVLHLKRFEFDLHTMTNVKLNERVEFPMELNMFPYTVEGLAEAEGAADAPPRRPDGYYTYALVGVVVHFGNANSGHYYSYIKERVPRDGTEPRWMSFNDRVVAPFDISELDESTFGGMLPNGRPKPYNAYLLFYERRDYDPTTGEQKRSTGSRGKLATLRDTLLGSGGSRGKADKRGASVASKRSSSKQQAPYSSMLFLAKLSRALRKQAAAAEVDEEQASGTPSDQGPVHPEALKAIWDDNMSFLMQSYIYAEEYSKFVYALVRLNQSDWREASTPTPSFQLAAQYVMTLQVYSTDKSGLRAWWTFLMEHLDHVPTASWFAEMLASSPTMMRMLLVSCPFTSIRESVSDLISGALHVLSRTESPYGLDPSTSYKREAMAVPPLVSALLKMSSHDMCGVTVSEYLRVMTAFAQLGKFECALMLQHNAAMYLLELYCGAELTLEFHGHHGYPSMHVDPPRETNYLPSREDRANLLDLVAYMIRKNPDVQREFGKDKVLTSPPSSEDAVAPVGKRIAASLGASNQRALMSPYFIALAGSDGGLIQEIAELMMLLSWEHPRFSQAYITTITKVITTPRYEPTKPFMRLLATLLDAKDSLRTLRIDAAVDRLLRRVDAMTGSMYKADRDRVLTYLAELAHSMPPVKAWMEMNRDRVQAVFERAGHPL